MKQYRIFFLATAFILCHQAWGALSMRHCLLLPIFDPSPSNTMAFQVFEKVEEYLKDSNWCTYRSSSNTMDLLQDYKNNLHIHLRDPELLKLLAEKSKAGSLIKIQLEKVNKKTHVFMAIIGGNGKDLYFRKKTRLRTRNSTIIFQTIRDWLESYERKIPYQGRIVGILGDQFTVDMGKLAGSYPSAEVIISRPLQKRKHPLLKKVVGWKTRPIAKGEIRHVSKAQSQGLMTSYYSDKYRPKLEDWIHIKGEKARDKKYKERRRNRVTDMTFKDTSYQFGRFGEFSFALNLGTSSVNASSLSSQRDQGDQKARGFLFGASFNAEIWATRLFWTSLEWGLALGRYSSKSETANDSSQTVSSGRTKFKAGYRYLPLGFFYGPRLDAYIGYARYGYNPSTRVFNSFTEADFSGLLMGLKGSLPVHKLFRFFALIDFIFSPDYEEELPLHGHGESVSSYNIEMGGIYNYSPIMKFMGNFVVTSHSVTLGSGKLTFKDVFLTVGTVFTF